MSLVKAADASLQSEDQRLTLAQIHLQNLSVHIVIGSRQVLSYKKFLKELSHRCGQGETEGYLEHFLDTRLSDDPLKKRPYLLLVGAGLPPSVETWTQENWQSVVGSVLAFDYLLLGCGTGIFSTHDPGGRRALLAPPYLRMHIARLAAEALMSKGALMVVHTMKYSALDQSVALPVQSSERTRWTFTTRRRAFLSYLLLENTMDATLTKMGQKSRFNLRYYRRRTEADFECIFVEEPIISREEFQAFNRRCTYAVGDEKAGWRYDAVMKFPGMFLYGIKARNGEWLSLIGGRRYIDAVEIAWQMNRDDLPSYSLSTVMRSYFIEHEIAQGSRKMYIEGGTPHTMRHSFVPEVVRDLVVLKHPALLRLARTIAKALAVKRPSLIRRFLVAVLMEEQLPWWPWS